MHVIPHIDMMHQTAFGFLAFRLKNITKQNKLKIR